VAPWRAIGWAGCSGWTCFAPGYGTASILGILLVGLGGGLGLQAARRWRAARQAGSSQDKQSAMSFVQPVVLSERGITLVPLELVHEAGLRRGCRRR
jgi:uncharacterized membrane protein